MSSPNLEIKRFTEDQADAWDDFVRQSAYNGSFVQTRHFLNYHPPERFVDHSLVITKSGKIVAAVPGCEIEEAGAKTLYSHKGSGFGGLVVHRAYFNTSYLAAIIKALEDYARTQGFGRIVLKQFPGLFSEGSVDALDYLFLINGYKRENDLTFVVDVMRLAEKETLSAYRANVRQQTKQGLDYGLSIQALSRADDIRSFHNLLVANLQKHGAQVVHTPEEFLDLQQRFPEDITFYGCFKDNKIIGGAMTWQYNDKVLHLQNIAISYEQQSWRPGNVLNHYLLEQARAKQIPYFSFGSSTEDEGRRLNFGLARFKEGFGAQGYLKYNFTKDLN